MATTFGLPWRDVDVFLPKSPNLRFTFGDQLSPAQPSQVGGRANICPAGICLASDNPRGPGGNLPRPRGRPRGLGIQLNLCLEAKNPRFGVEAGQIWAKQGFTWPPLFRGGREFATPCQPPRRPRIREASASLRGSRANPCQAPHPGKVARTAKGTRDGCE